MVFLRGGKGSGAEANRLQEQNVIVG